jgi:hypothetical protein
MLRFANGKGIFTAIATDPKGSFAFVHKIAMTVAFSEMRVAFRNLAFRAILLRVTGISHHQ